MKSKSKASIEAKQTKEAKEAEEAKQAEEAEKTGEVAKASEEENVLESAVDAAEKENTEIPNSIQAEEETLLQKYKKAFSIDQFELN